MGMPRGEVDKQLGAIGCQKPSRRSGLGIFSEISCDTKDGHLKLLLTKGVVDKLETEVLKRVDFTFQSSAGLEQVITQVSADFHVAPPEPEDSRQLIAEAKRGKVYVIWGRKVQGQGGDIAGWPLEEGLHLTLTLNQFADDKNPDEYILQLRSSKELDAEKQAKDAAQERRVVKPTPKF